MLLIEKVLNQVQNLAQKKQAQQSENESEMHTIFREWICAKPQTGIWVSL